MSISQEEKRGYQPQNGNFGYQPKKNNGTDKSNGKNSNDSHGTPPKGSKGKDA